VDIVLPAPGNGKNGRIERADVERSLAGGNSVGEQHVVATPPPAKEDMVVEL
jgi:hypothetical protein